MEAAATGDLIVSAFQSEPGESLRLELFDEQATTLLATGANLLDENGDVSGEQIVFAGSAGQSFLVRVLAEPGTEGGSYSLEVQSLTADLGTRVYGTVDATLDTGDEASYLLRTGASGSLEIVLTSAGTVLGNLNLELLDPDDLSVLVNGQASVGPGPGEVERASLAVQQNQLVLIHVSGDAESQGDFTLEFTNLDQFTTPENARLVFAAGSGPSSAAIGDLDSDGNPDLAVASGLSDTISVLLANGDGTFQVPRQFAVGAFVPTIPELRLPAYGRDVAIADFDGDAIPDLAVPNAASSDVSVLLIEPCALEALLRRS